MIKWDLVLGAEAFYQLHRIPKRFEKDRDLIKKYQDLLEQHRTVLSSSLRELYEQYYYENAISELDELETFFDDLVSYADNGISDPGLSYVMVSPVFGTSVNEVLSSTVNSSSLQNPIVVCDSEDQVKEIGLLVRTTPTIDRSVVSVKGMDNRIYRNSIIFSKDMYPDDFTEFNAWLKEAFRGEKDIDIFDPYFHSDSGLRTFIKYYIDNIEKEACISIYTANNNVIYKENWERFFFKAQQRKLHVKLYLVDKGSDHFDFHERRIYFNVSGRRLVIGHGLDTIRVQYNKDGKRSVEMRDCHLTIDDDMNYRAFFIRNHVYTELTKEKILECC